MDDEDLWTLAYLIALARGETNPYQEAEMALVDHAARWGKEAKHGATECDPGH